MDYQNAKVRETAELLNARFAELADKRDILRAVELRALYAEIPQLPAEQRASFGQEINALRAELQQLVDEAGEQAEALPPIDVTAPFDVNVPADQRPRLLPSETGSKHPLMTELELVLDIFYRMGFNAVESREIDDDFHMFGALNFPEGHPARDDYDTFMTTQTDANGKPLIAPAHTSTMQNRVLKKYIDNLERANPSPASSLAAFSVTKTWTPGMSTRSTSWKEFTWARAFMPVCSSPRSRLFCRNITARSSRSVRSRSISRLPNRASNSPSAARSAIKKAATSAAIPAGSSCSVAA
jgi:phenylalanyl-tRNA synthetase alpha subunit